MDWFLHNPIGDMPGPQFLVFYLLVIVLTTVGASLWRKAADPTRALAPPGVPLYPDPYEIAHATQVATAQLNARARPWIWGRPQPKHRSYRRRFVYAL